MAETVSIDRPSVAKPVSRRRSRKPDTVLMRKTIRGSIVGTRLDLAECLQFAGDGKVKVHYSTERLEDINSIFGRMRDNKIDGRVVMKI